MVIHVAAAHGLAGLKASSAHHLGAGKAAAAPAPAGGGGKSMGHHAMEYLIIFASIKALGYHGATYMWACSMGMLIGGPVGAVCGAMAAQSAYQKKAGIDPDKLSPEEMEPVSIDVSAPYVFRDADGDENTLEKRGDGRLWYKPQSNKPDQSLVENIPVDAIQYKQDERRAYINPGPQSGWYIPVPVHQETEILNNMRALCQAAGTQGGESLKKARAETPGEREAKDAGCKAGCCMGCGVGAACGVGVGAGVLAGCGELGGNTLLGNVAQTAMIKHVTCPAASCCGAVGGGISGFGVGSCCAPEPKEGEGGDFK